VLVWAGTLKYCFVELMWGMKDGFVRIRRELEMLELIIPILNQVNEKSVDFTTYSLSD